MSASPDQVSLDGRRFVMRSSTASDVNPESPSWFEYHERDGAIWGEYGGDTVTFGRFVGTREADVIHVSFVHVLVADGSAVSGVSDDVLRMTADGLELVENFTIDGVDHISVCVEA
jgi:hypothetical protein